MPADQVRRAGLPRDFGFVAALRVDPVARAGG